ncbi:MAG: AMP-binding enzyme, partial [Planctomycetota bacterium]
MNTQASPITLADAAAEDRLAVAIAEVARQSPDRVAIVAGAGAEASRSIDYATLAAAIAKLEEALDTVRPVGIVARAKRVESLVAIAAACGRQHVPVAFLAEDARDLVGELRDWVTVDDALAVAADPTAGRREFEAVATQVVVATSGTSGPPKLVEHSWDSLLAAARLAE